MKRCFQIQPGDNVAVLLEDAGAETLRVIGGCQIQSVILVQPIGLGHKVALADIAEGDPIVKFGVPIGLATTRIAAGDWVHLHNCRSQVDERSAALDLRTGAAHDTPYE
jgi:hypothetical protein